MCIYSWFVTSWDNCCFLVASRIIPTSSTVLTLFTRCLKSSQLFYPIPRIIPGWMIFFEWNITSLFMLQTKLPRIHAVSLKTTFLVYLLSAWKPPCYCYLLLESHVSNFHLLQIYGARRFYLLFWLIWSKDWDRRFTIGSMTPAHAETRHFITMI